MSNFEEKSLGRIKKLEREVERLKVKEKADPSGWTPATGTWTYASATTITVPSGAASFYSVGDKIKLTQTTVKYFYIVAVADTLLTITGGSGYTLANEAITSHYYSHASNPAGFPDYFTVSQPTWTASDTPFTNQPSSQTWVFSMSGLSVSLLGFGQMHATSGGTGRFYATFPVGALPPQISAGIGTTINYSSTEGGFAYSDYSGGQIIVRMSKYDVTTAFTNSQYWGVKVVYK